MRRGLVGLLVAEGVSILGTRMSALALPWFVYVTTGSPARTGLVAFAELLPYVLTCAAGGPALDRIGARRTSIAADAGSALAVVSIPLLHAAGSLHFGALVVLVGTAGLLRGFGDTAKRVVFPRLVAGSGVVLTRATSLHDGISRLAILLGAALWGVLIAAFDAPDVLLLDAATFAFAAVAVALAVPRIEAGPAAAEPYLRSLRGGLAFVARTPLIRGVLLMVLATNLFDQARAAVLSPIWAREVAGSGVALGVLSACFGVGAVLGNVIFTVVAPRVPRFLAFAIGFLVAGSPQFFAPALTDRLWPVYAVAFVSGFAVAGVNPILGAVLYELVPEQLRSRVLGLTFAVSWAGMPLGALLGGWTVQLLGLRATWLIFGGLYLLVTLVPFVQPEWRAVDRKPEPAPALAEATAH